MQPVGQTAPDALVRWLAAQRSEGEGGEMAQLRLEMERLLAVLKNLRAHETYRALVGIADWERYFGEARQRLAEDVERLRAQLEEDDDEF